MPMEGTSLVVGHVVAFTVLAGNRDWQPTVLTDSPETWHFKTVSPWPYHPMTIMVPQARNISRNYLINAFKH
ncbi:hypothetical protein CPC08DRAFT_354751 [Agrocybe pediades]|nr:hypothetical protein CPC08DRAFT_354751 [Agrocybe pediades]